MNIRKNIRFPKKELNSWLRINKIWNDQEWEELLAELNHSGFEAWIWNQEKRYQVGLFLKTHRL